MAPYQYQPLSEEKKEIRLLTIHSETFESAMVLSLDTVVLTKTQIPVFEALSYAWGDASDRVDIVIKTRILEPHSRRIILSRHRSSTLPITKNLFHALKHLRRQSESRIFWVDTICVNQEDLDERSSQVQRMADIYSSAQKVVVWLGVASGNSAMAMESIDDLGSQLAFDWDRRVFVAHSPSDIDPRSSKFREDMMPVCNTTLWVSIKDLLNRSWFERLWIWQEVQLAEDLISLVCGNIEIDFQHFCHAVRWLYKHRSDLPSLDQAYQIAHQISSKQSMSYTRSLTQLWYRMRRCKCSNERDRVYGMLNLTKINKIQTQILPDYTKSVQEVFQTLLMQQLSDESSLDLLKLCSLSDASSNLPTWLSWSMPPEFRRFGSGKADAGASPKAHCDGGDVLVVTGVSIADIAWASLGSGSWSEVSSSGSPQDYTSLTKAIENLMSESIGSLDIVVARPMIKSLCRSMYFHRCTEDYVPPRDSLVRFQEVVNSFEECWKISLNENTRSHLNHDRKGLLGACEMMRGRVTITTASGLLGIGPEGTREGDKVCIIIGCRNPLVLRHQENQHYQIVGECSVDGIMTGEAILGPLPSGCKLVTKRYPEHKAYFHAFLNCDTGETQIEDPRLGSLPPGWRVKSHNNQDVINWYVNDETGEDAEYKHPGLRIDALKKRGVKFEEFRLV